MIELMMWIYAVRWCVWFISGVLAILCFCMKLCQGLGTFMMSMGMSRVNFFGLLFSMALVGVSSVKSGNCLYYP